MEDLGSMNWRNQETVLDWRGLTIAAAVRLANCFNAARRLPIYCHESAAFQSVFLDNKRAILNGLVSLVPSIRILNILRELEGKLQSARKALTTNTRPFHASDMLFIKSNLAKNSESLLSWEAHFYSS